VSRAATIHPPRKASPADMRAIAADLIHRSNVLLDQADAARTSAVAMAEEAARWCEQADAVEGMPYRVTVDGPDGRTVEVRA
jgi:hypothetical protein